MQGSPYSLTLSGVRDTFSAWVRAYKRGMVVSSDVSRGGDSSGSEAPRLMDSHAVQRPYASTHHQSRQWTVEKVMHSSYPSSSSCRGASDFLHYLRFNVFVVGLVAPVS